MEKLEMQLFKRLFPKISIVVPFYNAQEYIDRCLSSILKGMSSSFEIICVNDGSTDKSAQIVKEYCKKNSCIRLIQFPANRGLYAARLEGVRKARGKYIGFVDSDDYVSEGYFEKLYKKIKEEKTDIAVGKIVNQSADNIKYVQTRCAVFPYTNEIKGKNLYDLYWEQEGRCYHWHVVWNKLYKKEVWRRAITVLKQQKTHLIMLEDFIFSSVVLSNIHTYTVDTDAKYYYVEHSEASTKDRGYEKIKINIRDMEKAFDFVEAFLRRQHSQYMNNFVQWKRRYARYWKRNVLQEKMPYDEEQACLHMLQDMVQEEIGEIELQDEYFYELAEEVD